MEEQVPRLNRQTMTLLAGPSHPATHGTVRFILELDGETVVKMDPEIGYLHRGFEKMCETVCWNQVMPYTDRLNYASPLLNNVAFCLAVEKLAGLRIPERAQYIRVIGGEVHRLCDHLTANTALAMEMGGFTVFLYLMEARELLWDLIEDLTGARMTVSYCRVGGVAHDLPADFADKWRKIMPRVRELIADVDTMLTKNRIFIDRTRNVGVISQEDAISYGWTGPCLRSTGIKHDLRKKAPYLVYDRFDFDVPTGTKGDNFDRYLVRVEEMRQSARIVDQALDQIPPGPFIVDDPRYALPPKPQVYGSIEGTIAHFKMIMEGIKIPVGEAYGYSEAANGELGFYVTSDGSGKPYRVRVRGPCFMMMSSMPHLCEGGMLADIIPTFDTINMIGGEIDR